MKRIISRPASGSRYRLAFVVLLISIALGGTRASGAPADFFASFKVSDGHGMPLRLELGLKKGGAKTKGEAFVLDSRLDPAVKIPVVPFIPGFIAQEVRQHERPFERWKPRARVSVSAECRQVLELSLRDGGRAGTWFYCVDLTEKDPQAGVARRWLNFVDESLRSQVHPMVRDARAKEKKK